MSDSAGSSTHWLRRLSLGPASASWGWLEAILIGLVLDVAVQVALISLLDNFELLDVEGAWGLIITQAVAIGGVLPILVYLKVSRFSIRDGLLLLRPKLRYVWLALRGAAVYVPLALLVATVVAAFAPDVLDVDQELGIEVGVVGFELAAAFLVLVIITPLVEEIIYRGFIFRGIAKSTNTWVGVIISSLIFGAVHGQIGLVIDTFVMGMVCAILVARSGSLWSAVMLHAFKNGLAFLLLFVQPLL